MRHRGGRTVIQARWWNGHGAKGVTPQATDIIQLLNKEEDMMKEAYAQSIECEQPCEGRLSRTVL